MKQARKPVVSRGRVAVLAVVACGAFLGSGASAAEAAPSIANTGTGCTSGQLAWLVSCTSTGEDGAQSNAKQLRVSVLVNGDATTLNPLASLLTDDDWDGTSDPSTVRSASVMTRPDIAVGYPRSRGTLQYVNPNADGDTGINSGTFCVGATRRTSGEFMRLQPRDTAGSTGGTTSSGMRFTAAGQCTGAEDFAYLFSWDGAGVGFTCPTGNPSGKNTGYTTNFDPTRSVTPGTDVRFCYRGDDPDSSGNEDFQGINWRLRNLRTGGTLGPTLSCPENGDNNVKGVTVDFPQRGSWVVEAELRDGGSCGQNQNAGYWFPIGTADVNSSAAPTGVLAADADTGTAGVQRPQFNGNVTAQATSLADTAADEAATDDGGVQIIEWDLDGSTTDTTAAPDGFEATSIAGVGSDLGTSEEIVHDTENETPGLHTIRMRLTDNGAMDAADSSRKRSSAAGISTTYLVDSAPTADAQTVTTDTNAVNVPITLTGSDPDSDTLTWTHGSASHGSIGGSGANLTYTPTAGYAGTDSFTITANDGFGRTDNAVVSINVRATATITDQPALLSNDSTPTFQFNSNGGPGTFQCKLDTGGFTSCSSPHTYGVTADGSHTFEVRPVATTGGVIGHSDTYTWTIDTTPPNTQIDDSPPTLSNSADASFEFSAPGDPTATFQCRLDNAPGGFTNCTSPQNYTSLSQGSHLFEVRATDSAGNTDPSPAFFNWTVDTIGPTVTLDTFPDDPTNEQDASFSFHADETVTGFQCEIDGGGFSPCSSPAEYPGLGEGSHTFSVKATDSAGNTGNATSFTWVIDITPPDTQIDTSPDALENSTMASFTYSAPGDPTATFQCKLDSGPFVPCNTQPQNYAGLSQGSHTFQVFATDTAGNSDATPASFTWIVDTIAPGTSIDEGSVLYPPPGINHPQHRTTSQDADFDFFGSNDANPPVTFECRLDSSDELDFQACTAPVHYTALNDGPHKFEVRAKDAAGNVDQTPATYQWSVHNGLPDTLLTDFPDDPTNSTSAHFEFDSSIPDSTFQCSLDGAPLAPCDSPENYTVTEGTHTFSVVATDDFGRDDPSPAFYEWTVDLTAPDTLIDDTPLNPSNSDSASFTFHSTEAGSSFECKLDLGSFQPCDETMPQVYTDLDDGTHTFQVQSTDPAGNLDPTPATFTWVVDTEAPSTTIDDQPTDPSRIVDPTFQFSSNETSVDFFCKLDTEAEVPCETDYQLNNLTEGTHTFSVYAVDQAGNVGSPDSYTWYVDLAPPDTTITDQPALLTNTASATFQFEGTDNHSNSGDLTFECRLNSAEESDFEPCSSGDTFTAIEGTNTFDVRALDEAGNWDPSPDSYEWVVDLTGPDTSITDQPPLLTNSGAAVFQFNGTDNHSDPGDLTFECQLDGGGFSPCTSGTDFGPVGGGSHTFEVRATDEATNTDQTPASYTWIVDQTEPETNITGQPNNPTNSSAAVFDFNGTDNHSAPGDLTFECQLDGAGFSPCTSGSDFGPVGDGSHTFEVRATDEANNTDSTPASFTWSVDLGAPETNITAQPDEPTNSSNAVFEFTSEPGASFECELDDGGFSPCNSGDDFGPVGPGSHTFKVRATDAVGNTDPTPAEYTWVVDQTEPDTNITGQPDDPTNSANAVFDFNGTDNHSDGADLTFECQLDGAGFSPCTSGTDFGPVGPGSHTFDVRATDEAANTDSTPASHTWVVDQTEPDTQITDQPDNPTSSSAAAFQFTATDNHSAAGDHSFECQLDGGGFNGCSSGDDLGPVGEGSHTVDVRATDQAGNTDSDPASYTWTVDQTAPVVDVSTGPPDPSNVDNGTIEFTVTGAPSTVECSLDGGAFTPCTSPHNLTGLSDGDHTVTVKATDAAGNEGTDDWNWTVDTGIPNTSITAAPVSPTSVNSASFGFTADEPSTFECSLDGSGFAACSSTQSYSGLTPGNHVFSVRATDTAGNTDPTPATHAWTVSSAQGGVLGAGGGLAPLIKRRVRTLNVPLEGAFQIATVTCRAGTCSLTEKKAVIKVGGKAFVGTVEIDMVVKQLAAIDTFQKGETAQVIVRFAPGVRQALAANDFGSLTVKLTARTDAGGGASDSKKIKLKSKWLKKLLG